MSEQVSEVTGATILAHLNAATQPTIGEVEIAEVIQDHTGCADSDSIYAAHAVLQALRPMLDDFASLQVIHNCLRRDYERSKAQVMAARELAANWHAEARAEGYGGGNTRAHLLLAAMDASVAV